MPADLAKAGDGSTIPQWDLATLYSSAVLSMEMAMKGAYVNNGITYTPPNVCDMLAVLMKLADAKYRVTTVTPPGPDLAPAQAVFAGLPLQAPFFPGKNF